VCFIFYDNLGYQFPFYLNEVMIYKFILWSLIASRDFRGGGGLHIYSVQIICIFYDLIYWNSVVKIKFQAALLQRWNLPALMCPFCPFVQVLSVNVSIFTLTAIAVDRHRAILSPLRLVRVVSLGKWINVFLTQQHPLTTIMIIITSHWHL